MDEKDDQNLGHLREEEVVNLLKRRFGENCVFQSPKVTNSGGEKELCDILVVALPYVLVFQLKWMKLSVDDLTGEKAKTYHDRLVRRMEKAAKQFNEFGSSLMHKPTIDLAKPWDESGGVFALPLEFIKFVLPIVLIDFEDPSYADPEQRYKDIPPIVWDAPEKVKKWGAVHGFLMKDFKTIAENLFTVGDLILWLQAREEMLAAHPRDILRFNELTLFSIYLAKFDLWEKMLLSDGVVLDDQSMYERIHEERRREFEKRRELFGNENLMGCIRYMLQDAIRKAVGRADEADQTNAYMSVQGRLDCLPAMIRKNASDKLRANLQKYGAIKVPVETANIVGSCLMLEQVLKRTLIYVGVADFEPKHAEMLLGYVYARMLANLKEQKRERAYDEAVVIIVRPKPMSLCCRIFPITQESFICALTSEQLHQTRYAFSKENFRCEEWDAVRKSLPAEREA